MHAPAVPSTEPLRAAPSTAVKQPQSELPLLPVAESGGAQGRSSAREQRDLRPAPSASRSPFSRGTTERAERCAPSPALLLRA